MEASCLIILVVWLSVFQTSHSTRNWWMEEPYKDDSFNVLGKYGENISINCQDHRQPDADEVLYWILPDLNVMNRSDYKDFQTIDGPAGWFISSNGTSVEVFLVQEQHFGFYYCVFSNRSTGSIEVIKKGLNYKGPYLGDLWPLYEKPVVIGCVAAGICMALFALLCIIYEVKFHEEIEVTSENEIAAVGCFNDAGLTVIASNNEAGSNNFGYRGEYDEAGIVTKRRNGDVFKAYVAEDYDQTWL